MKFRAQGWRSPSEGNAVLNGRSRTVEFTEVKAEGSEVSFIELLNLGGNEIRIQYTGQMEGETIRFTRKVGDVANEQAIAKRITSVDELITENAQAATRGSSGSMRQQAIAMGDSVDPNFHIYLCFGQSNMESGGRMDDADPQVPERVLVMADFDNADRGWKKGIGTMRSRH